MGCFDELNMCKQDCPPGCGNGEEEAGEECDDEIDYSGQGFVCKECKKQCPPADTGHRGCDAFCADKQQYPSCDDCSFEGQYNATLTIWKADIGVWKDKFVAGEHSAVSAELRYRGVCTVGGEDYSSDNGKVIRSNDRINDRGNGPNHSKGLVPGRYPMTEAGEVVCDWTKDDGSSNKCVKAYEAAVACSCDDVSGYGFLFGQHVCNADTLTQIESFNAGECVYKLCRAGTVRWAPGPSGFAPVEPGPPGP
jgi:hypothetical protein